MTADLERLGDLDAVLAESGLAAAALVLAVELDDSSNSATSKSMCARALIDTMDRLRELAPTRAEVSALDELRVRRNSRRRSAAS